MTFNSQNLEDKNGILIMSPLAPSITGQIIGVPLLVIKPRITREQETLAFQLLTCLMSRSRRKAKNEILNPNSAFMFATEELSLSSTFLIFWEGFFSQLAQSHIGPSFIPEGCILSVIWRHSTCCCFQPRSWESS